MPEIAILNTLVVIMLPPEIARTPPRTGTQRPDLTENTGAEIPQQGSLTPDTEPRFACHRLLRPAGRSVVPTVPGGWNSWAAMVSPEEDKGCPAPPSGRYSRSGRFRMPVSPCRTGPRHGPEDTVFILQLFLEIENRRTPPALASRRGLPHRSPPARDLFQLSCRAYSSG